MLVPRTSNNPLPQQRFYHAESFKITLFAVGIILGLGGFLAHYMALGLVPTILVGSMGAGMTVVGFSLFFVEGKAGVKSEVKSQTAEVGKGKSEVRSQKSEVKKEIDAAPPVQVVVVKPVDPPVEPEKVAPVAASVPEQAVKPVIAAPSPLIPLLPATVGEPAPQLFVAPSPDSQPPTKPSAPTAAASAPAPFMPPSAVPSVPVTASGQDNAASPSQPTPFVSPPPPTIVTRAKPAKTFGNVPIKGVFLSVSGRFSTLTAAEWFSYSDSTTPDDISSEEYGRIFDRFSDELAPYLDQDVTGIVFQYLRSPHSYPPEFPGALASYQRLLALPPKALGVEYNRITKGNQKGTPQVADYFRQYRGNRPSAVAFRNFLNRSSIPSSEARYEVLEEDTTLLVAPQTYVTLLVKTQTKNEREFSGNSFLMLYNIASQEIWDEAPIKTGHEVGNKLFTPSRLFDVPCLGDIRCFRWDLPSQKIVSSKIHSNVVSSPEGIFVHQESLFIVYNGWIRGIEVMVFDVMEMGETDQFSRVAYLRYPKLVYNSNFQFIASESSVDLLLGCEKSLVLRFGPIRVAPKGKHTYLQLSELVNECLRRKDSLEFLALGEKLELLLQFRNPKDILEEKLEGAYGLLSSSLKEKVFAEGDYKKVMSLKLFTYRDALLLIDRQIAQRGTPAIIKARLERAKDFFACQNPDDFLTGYAETSFLLIGKLFNGDVISDEMALALGASFGT